MKRCFMLLFCICSSVEAYSSGAPRGACYSLKPGHSGYAQAASSVPTTCALSTCKIIFTTWYT